MANTTLAANSNYLNGPQAVGRRIAMTFQQAEMKGDLVGANLKNEWNYDFTVTTPLILSSLSVTKIESGLALSGPTYGDLLTVGIYKTYANQTTGILEEETLATAQVAFSSDVVAVILGESHFAGVLDKASNSQLISLSTTGKCNKTHPETSNNSEATPIFFPASAGIGGVGIRIKIYAERADAAVTLDPSVAIVAEFFEGLTIVDSLNTDSSEAIFIASTSSK